MDYKKKCKTCPKSTHDFMCLELCDKCSKCYTKCSDKRVCCEMCANFENDYCKIDGHFKDGNTFRICKEGFKAK